MDVHNADKNIISKPFYLFAPGNYKIGMQLTENDSKMSRGVDTGDHSQ